MNDLKYKHINISNSLLKQNFIWHYVKNQIQLYMYDSLTHFILGYKMAAFKKLSTSYLKCQFLATFFNKILLETNRLEPRSDPT